MTEIVNSQVADLLTKPFEISVNKKPVSLTERNCSDLRGSECLIAENSWVHTCC